jgi:branched-chain amino acid transport system permease protein
MRYDPSDRVIWLYLVALLLVVVTLFVINRLLRMPLGRAEEYCVKMRLPVARWA